MRLSANKDGKDLIKIYAFLSARLAGVAKVQLKSVPFC
jgi:hypothetical protein